MHHCLPLHHINNNLLTINILYLTSQHHNPNLTHSIYQHNNIHPRYIQAHFYTDSPPNIPVFRTHKNLRTEPQESDMEERTRKGCKDQFFSNSVFFFALTIYVFILSQSISPQCVVSTFIMLILLRVNQILKASHNSTVTLG